ncbi:HAD-IA family hydrolase [Pseudovibrio sp. Tun.PSC04-5.I4]|uniref:HAD-IA family hydrolase n=1 Tax=Pseudovibrio sp. Tun.PSC04-5.I4 TaxID=1798213 RepID=UPI0008913840|nr:HAD-IA family hydrolase [Pseudovibrio sp. Tun.PSC04-5.I4]SDR44895.1 haloacid dehalogenase superfamily, subfamily IA, variant 1 with third motif having Dx(3-4)D or Dx(3-4)E [Pseudovibrio sp. Tun.PSC04-5.I4]
MKNSKLSRILLLSNLGTDLSDPDFRVGSYVNYLIPIAKNLLEAKQISVKLLVNERVGSRVVNEVVSSGISPDIMAEIDCKRLTAERLDNFMIKSYRESFSLEQESLLSEVIQDALGDWQPDIIICWEAPTYYFRSMYPDALVLDLMPGMFMRPPYPKMISIDPVGLYKDCWYADQNIDEFTAPDEVLLELNRLRQYYVDHFDKIGTYEAFSFMTKDKHIERAALVPLQISSYFGWRDNCDFKDQFEYLKTVLSNVDQDISCYVTQYISKLTAETVITESNEKYLRDKYKNFIHDKKFNHIDSISQYIIPNVDSVYAVSSNLGIQAKFFGKKLYSMSNSHLAYLSDKEPKVGEDAENRNINPFIANYLYRTNFLWDKIKNDSGYVLDILNDFYLRRKRNGIEKFPEFEAVNNDFASIIKSGNTSASERNFKKLHTAEISPAHKRIKGHKSVIASGKYDTISFDVFDTLVCRTVLRPAEIFDLIEKQLEEKFDEKLSKDFITSFARNRAGQERKLRFQLDNEDNAETDELQVQDVYQEILSLYGLPVGLAPDLVALEQEVEISCLRPRPIGVELYNQAIESGKKVLIISDFIHPTRFVEKVLLHSGISSWDHIYVSSDVGKKKHSGELFDHVCSKLSLDRSKILHFGDNAHGDIKMANSKGIDARHLKSGPALLNEVLMERRFNLAAIRESVVTSAILCGHANQYFAAGERRNAASKSMELIANEEEFGFLLIGPIMHFFAKWILEQAEDMNVDQVLFFARDTKLPFEMLQNLVDRRDAYRPKAFYLPVSRAALSGVDIFQPEDLRKIRIDDFPKDKTLRDLLEQRFMLLTREISQSEMTKWSESGPANIKVKSVPEMAIYEIAVQSALENWGDIQERFNQKRERFIKLLDQHGVDTTLTTIAVDFGYKGTIHRKINPLFSKELIPRFFMSYSNNWGEDPIENLEVFYKRNLVPQDREADPFLKFNLILETLLNEGKGSALDYQFDKNGRVGVIRDQSVDERHELIIQKIHVGALEFSQYWITNCNLIEDNASWCTQLQSYLYSKIMHSPSILEASMLADLKFDNNYSGHQARSIIERNAKGVSTGVAIWKEGMRVLKPKASVAARKKQPEEGAYKSWRLVYAPIVRYFVGKLGNKKDLVDFDRNPQYFFEQLREPKYNRIGKLLFP